MKQCAKKKAPGSNRAAVRDHTGGIKAETSLTEGEPELRAHQRVVQAHSGRCVGVRGKFENSEGWVLHRGLELGKEAQCQGRADHAGKVRQKMLDRGREEQEVGMSSQGWWEFLQFLDECNGLFSTILNVRGDVIVSTYRCTVGNKPVSCMLDVKDAR
jgi:hypothetical protein